MRNLTTATKITQTRGKTGLDYEEGDKSTKNEIEDIIHRDINTNEKETNRDDLEEVID